MAVKLTSRRWTVVAGGTRRWGILFALCVLLSTGQLFAQATKSQYPKYILGGMTVRVPETLDTLWVLKHSQYKKAIEIARLHELDTATIELLKRKFGLQQEVSAQKDSLIVLYKEGYFHYRDLWQETDEKLEEAEVKASKRWTFFQWGFVTGAIATAVTAALVAGVDK